MSAVKNISSFRLASLLRREDDPSAAIKLFRNPDPGSTNPKRPLRYSLLCYDLMITKLGSSKMSSSSSSPIPESVGIVQPMSNSFLSDYLLYHRIVPTEILFCNVINYFGRGRLPTRALLVFVEMPQYRCQRTVRSVNPLLSALLKCGAFDKMKEVLSSIDKYGKPDACTYNILINGYSQSGCFDDALKLFEEMVKKKVKPTGVTFGTLVSELCKNFKVKEALKMKHHMLKVYGVCPTVHVYASLIKALCQIGELSLAFKLKDEAYEGKIKIDSAIYSTLISSIIKAGRSAEVTGILEEMRKKGCEPDTVTYNVLTNGFCVENDLESAYRVLDEMVDKGVKPDIISYNMILGALFRIKNWKEGAYLFEDMPRRGCIPDILSYRIVFDGLCEGRSCATIAFDYFTQKLMEESGGNCRERNDFKRMRRVFEYIEDADIWKWELPGSKAFNSGIVDLGIEYDLNQNQTLFQKLLSLDHESVINRGRESLSRKHKLIQEALEQSYEIVLGGDEEFGWCLAVNADENAELRSELGNQLAEKRKRMRLRGVGAVVYRVPELEDAAKLKISLRSVAEEDTTQVSQRFGGGGHKNASSLLLSSVELEQWKVKRN
ncbi:BnaA05g14530D [Brassica napus]|uniref:(rape) hypothetical protein n=1 Tax=Brassica napus TaxID=3708 RepID=A0A078GL36_BRANA|nr:unnamed protein product [Brassica napus]CDY25862.1 BnaA05g14530D [Brassica napus]